MAFHKTHQERGHWHDTRFEFGNRTAEKRNSNCTPIKEDFFMRFRFRDVVKTVLISLGWMIVISAIGIVMLFLFGNPNHTDAVLTLVGICFIPIFVMTMLTIHKHLVRKSGLGWESLGFVALKKKEMVRLAWQIPFCWFLIILTQITFLFFLVGESNALPRTQSSAEILAFTPTTFILVFLAYAILTPILEEIIFRGGLFQAFANKFNTPLAIMASSTLFMLVHSFSPLIMPGIFVAGLFLAYLYQKYRSIYAPISLHIFINGINVLAVNFLF